VDLLGRVCAWRESEKRFAACCESGETLLTFAARNRVPEDTSHFFDPNTSNKNSETPES
jgi:hypothetical protein